MILLPPLVFKERGDYFFSLQCVYFLTILNEFQLPTATRLFLLETRLQSRHSTANGAGQPGQTGLSTTTAQIQKALRFSQRISQFLTDKRHASIFRDANCL